MAEYEVQDDNGNTLTVTGDSPPTEEELTQIFSRNIGTPTTGGSQTFNTEPDRPKPTDAPNGFVQELPQTMGGIAGGIAGATQGAAIGSVIPVVGTVGGAIVGGAIGAGLGGASAKGYQQLYQNLTGNPTAPKTSKEAAIEIAKAGGEEAAWDLGGNLALKALGKTFHLVRPKAVNDIEKLAVSLEGAGGRFTASQRTNNWMVHQLDSLTRGSLTGSGTMKTADAMNEVALKQIESNLRTKVAKNATQHLSDREVGELFIDTVNGGKAGHRTVVTEMYNGFDQLVPSKTVQTEAFETIDTGIINPATGLNFTTTTSKMVDEVINPVSTGNLKQSLMKFREQLERIKYAGETPESRKLLDSIFAQEKTLSFSDAQALRSNLLDAQRNLEGTFGKSKITGKVNTVVDELTKAMDSAALKQGDGVASNYSAIKKFARTGYEAFDNKFIADLVVADKKNPERIGEYIFRTGNVEEIRKVKKALRMASVLGKKQGVSYDKAWTQMQSGYLDSLLRRSGKASEVGADATSKTILEEGLDISGEKLIKEFSDPKKIRTLTEVFGARTRSDILEFAKMAERTQRKPEGGLGMLMQLTQGGAVIALVKGALAATEAGTLFVVPKVMAKVMTSDGGAKFMATAMQTPAGSKGYALIASKLAKYVADATKELEGEDTQQGQQ